MKGFCERHFKVYEHEFNEFLWLASLFFVRFFVVAIFRNYVDASFIKRFGVHQIPLMMAINGLFSFAVFWLLGRVSWRFRDQNLLAGFFFTYGILVTGIFFMVEAGMRIAYPILYQLLYLQDALFPVYLWKITNEMFDNRQGKRIFRLIIAIQMLGLISGSFFTTPLARIIGADRTLLVFSISCLGIAAFIVFTSGRILRGDHYRKERTDTGSSRVTEIPSFIRKYPVFRYLFVTALIPSILIPIFTYQFNIIANDVFASEDGLISFLSYLRGCTYVVVFIVLFAMARFYSRMKLARASLIHPVNCSLVFGGLTTFFNIYVAAYGQFSFFLIQRAVAVPLINILFNLLPRHIIAWARLFISGNVYMVGITLGALLMMASRPLFPAQYLAPLALILAFFWLLESLIFTRRYRSSLKQVIVEESIDFDHIDAVSGLDQHAGHPCVRDEAAAEGPGEVSEDVGGAKSLSRETALKLLDDADETARARAVKALGEMRDIRVVNRLVHHLEDREVVRKVAIEALAGYGKTVGYFLETALVDRPLIVQRGILEVFRLSGQRDFDPMPFLGRLLLMAYHNLIAVQVISRESVSPSLDMLEAHLREKNEEILSLAFHALWVNYADMRLMYGALRSSRGSVAVEMLQTSVPRRISDYLIPLIDEIPLEERILCGRRLFPLPETADLGRVFALLSTRDDPTTRMLIVYAIGDHSPDESYFPTVEVLLSDAHEHVAQAAEYAQKRCSGEEADMPKIVRLIEELKRFSLFEGMGIRELQAIASITRRERYRPGEVIFRSGDENMPLVLLVAGRMDIQKDYPVPEERVVTLDSGCFIGEVSIFSGKPNITTGIARDPLELLVIGRHQLEEVMRIYPQIGVNLCRFFARKMRGILISRHDPAEILAEIDLPGGRDDTPDVPEDGD